MTLAIVGTLVFSFRPILVKLIYVTYPASAVTVLFLRMAISLPFFLVVAWWLRREEPRLTRRDWAALVALGFIGYYAASFLDFIGLQYVGAGVGRLILYLYPTLVLLISFLFLHRRPTQRQLAALVITYAGVALILSSQAQGGAAGKLFMLGALFVFASSLFYATYLVAGGELVKRIGAAEFALIGALGPVSVAITSALGLDEQFTAVQALGGALVIFGVLLVSLKRN